MKKPLKHFSNAIAMFLEPLHSIWSFKQNKIVKINPMHSFNIFFFFFLTAIFSPKGISINNID